MESNKIIYEIKTASEKEIYIHLKECSSNFIPPLSDRISLEDYAKKIFEKSVTFEAWSEEILVGVIAAYFNDPLVHSAFITNVSVIKSYMGSGIASKLLTMCIEYAVKNSFKEINLEVYEGNIPAISFYKKHNFIANNTKEGFLLMKFNITKN